MNLLKFLRYEIFFVVREIYGTSTVLYLIKKHTFGDQKTIKISEMKHYRINFRNIQKIKICRCRCLHVSVSARVGVCTCRCLHVSVSARVGVCTCRCMHVSVSARVCLHVSVSARVGVCTCRCLHVSVSARVGVCTCCCRYVCMCRCLCTCLCIFYLREDNANFSQLSPNNQPWRKLSD